MVVVCLDLNTISYSTLFGNLSPLGSKWRRRTRCISEPVDREENSQPIIDLIDSGTESLEEVFENCFSAAPLNAEEIELMENLNNLLMGHKDCSLTQYITNR